MPEPRTHTLLFDATDPALDPELRIGVVHTHVDNQLNGPAEYYSLMVIDQDDQLLARGTVEPSYTPDGKAANQKSDFFLIMECIEGDAIS